MSLSKILQCLTEAQLQFFVVVAVFFLVRILKGESPFALVGISSMGQNVKTVKRISYLFSFLLLYVNNCMLMETLHCRILLVTHQFHTLAGVRIIDTS